MEPIPIINLLSIYPATTYRPYWLCFSGDGEHDYIPFLATILLLGLNNNPIHHGQYPTWFTLMPPQHTAQKCVLIMGSVS